MNLIKTNHNKMRKTLIINQIQIKSTLNQIQRIKTNKTKQKNNRFFYKRIFLKQKEPIKKIIFSYIIVGAARHPLCCTNKNVKHAKMIIFITKN